MSARKKKSRLILTIVFISTFPFLVFSANSHQQMNETPLRNTWGYRTLAKQLGWVISDENNCGGYYLDPPFIFPLGVEKKNAVEITSNHGLISQRGTSFLEEKVVVNRGEQQMTSDKAFVYRDTSGKLSAIDMIGDVHFREPNTLVVAKKGRYNLDTHAKSLINILYRTALSTKENPTPAVSCEDIQRERKISALTAWGRGYEFLQTLPRVYEVYQSSFTTCPPIDPAWRVKASHIVLNKNSGRGYATHARILVKNIPVFYIPYINFSIDKQRKTGFLWPTLGGSTKWGPYLLTPFYWNIAPNYDMTITPGILSKRGLLVSDNFRYLTRTSQGNLYVAVLPHDRFFKDFQDASEKTYQNSTDPVIQAELNRLLNSSTTRKSLIWRDESVFTNHWSSHMDFNYVSDDYYLHDNGSDLKEITQNMLLQEGVIYYKNEHWNFTGRLHSYQALHPINEVQVFNAYRRLPQLLLSADYPDQFLGLEYFINNDVTHFAFLKTPGMSLNSPTGNRFHTQPGISLPLFWPYFYVNPRMQLALTKYDLYQTNDMNVPKSKHRAVPIFDIATGLLFNRDIALFGQSYQQTLEPQAYYTYIPYRNQSSIPIFDTTVSTLVYDQIFNYNRFSGLDRIGDANQIGLGVTTRLIDHESGFEKVRLGLGGIVYFSDRLVTLCNNKNSCSDYPGAHGNVQRLSPLSGVFHYNVNPTWRFSANAIWNPVAKQLDNTTLTLHYQTDTLRLFNLGYSYARDVNGDPSGILTSDAKNNLKVTDFSFSWPLMRDVSLLGRWSQNWNQRHLQNLIYGLQYDTCCWAARLVGGRAFLGLDPTKNNKPQYNSEFYIQFALKGLGNISTGNPNGLLSNISGYKTQFGQEF